MNDSPTPHSLLWCGRPRRTLEILALTAASLAICACGDREARGLERGLAMEKAGMVSNLVSTRRVPRPALERERTITLEENAEVINVAPEVFLDPAGGFLVSDEKEAQIRRYSAEGKVLWRAGRRGNGPGEFAAPTAVVRLASGEVVAFDRGGRFTVFDREGKRVVRTFLTRLRHVSDAAVLNGSSVLVAAIPEGDWNAPRLHVVDPATGTVRSDLFDFAPFRTSPAQAAATIAGWVKLSVRGDRVAAIFATSDTVYVFDTSGRLRRNVAIPFEHFRAAPRRTPHDGNSDPRSRMRWLSSFDMVADVHWLGNGDLLVPWQRIDERDVTTRHWNLLRMTADGRRRQELREVPRLLEVDGARSALFFVDPEAEAPNRWFEARLPG